MKKKILIAAVAVAVLTAIVAFILTGLPSEKAQETTAVEGQPITVNIEPETTKKERTTSYNKKVTVTLPADVIDEKYGGDLDAFADAEGYYSAKLTKDGQVKIRMRAFSYDLLLANMGLDAIESIGYALDSGNYPFFRDIVKYNYSFDYIVIAVDKVEYEKAENRDSLFTDIAYSCFYYQSYDVDSKGQCEIVVCEEGTNILIESRVVTADDLG